MALEIEPSGQACGARVSGVDLTKPLSDHEVAEIRAAWLEHLVLSFPNQKMNDDDLERFTLSMGGFGNDPYIAPIPGRSNVIAVKREADETAPLFAGTWHSDWSFQEVPPAGTCLLGLIIPPKGGDTLFANQHMALEQMPADMRAKLEGKMAIHSARLAYAPDGTYGEGDKGRSMDILTSKTAEASHLHPVIRDHPETGRKGLFSCAGYIVGIEGMDQAEATALLTELYQWQGRPEFQYRHKWAQDMMVMWDNRSVLHMATGGYEGYDRLLHRTTIAGIAA